MKYYKLTYMITVFMMALSLMTPLHAKEETDNRDCPQPSQSNLIDTTPVVETINEKVILFDIIKSGARQTIPYNKTIAVNFQTQQNDYYCGPAAVRMVLGATGKIYSQDYIAGQIGTTTSGTGFGGTLLNAMNALCGSGFSFNLAWGGNQLADRSVIAIYYGNPVLVDTCELNDFRIAGHSASNIVYHYAAVNGYKNSGNTLVYTDPAYGRYSGTEKQHDYPSSDIAALCSQLGYIW